MGDLNTNFCRPNGPVFPAVGTMTRRPEKCGGWVSRTRVAGGLLRWEILHQDGPGS